MKVGDRVRCDLPNGMSGITTDTNGVSAVVKSGSEGVVLAEPTPSAAGFNRAIVELDSMKGRQFEICDLYITVIQPPTPSNKVCVCKMDQLVFGGCICGAMEFERNKK